MAGRPRIYEEVDKEMKLEELVRTACDLFGPPYDDREPDMFTRKSIREVGRIMGLSQEKTRRLLIEGGWYSTQETRSVRKLMRQGLKDDEIAKELDIPVKKVSSLKPYKDTPLVWLDNSFLGMVVILRLIEFHGHMVDRKSVV